jgi:hypothetical protein
MVPADVGAAVKIGQSDVKNCQGAALDESSRAAG